MSFYKLEDFPGKTRNDKALALLRQAQEDGMWIIPLRNDNFETDGKYRHIIGYQVLDRKKMGTCEVKAFFYIESSEFLPGFEHAIIGRG